MGFAPKFSPTGKTDDGTDEGGDDGGDDDNTDNSCVDKNSRCAEWAARDPSECGGNNWTYMKTNCQKSCQQCGCADVGPKCAEWKGKVS